MPVKLSRGDGGGVEAAGACAPWLGQLRRACGVLARVSSVVERLVASGACATTHTLPVQAQMPDVQQQQQAAEEQQRYFAFGFIF